jgi:hypothetical protein
MTNKWIPDELTYTLECSHIKLLIPGFKPSNLTGRTRSRTALEYSNAIGRERLRQTATCH